MEGNAGPGKMIVTREPEASVKSLSIVDESIVRMIGRTSASEVEDAGRSVTGDLLLTLRPQARASTLTAELRRRIATILGIDGQTLPVDQPLIGFGLEPIRMTRLHHDIEHDCGISLRLAKFVRTSGQGLCSGSVREIGGWE